MPIQHLYKQISTENSVFYAWFEAMHTRIDIALCNMDEENATSLTEEIYTEIKRIEQMSDRFNLQSELSQVNRLAALNPYKISDELYSILEKCIDYRELTLGAFDITIQSFNDYRQGINDIILDSETKTVFFNNPNVQLDLNGFVKGYALDEAKSLLKINNCNNALVNFGNSSILALGNHPNGKGWKVNLPESVNEYINLQDQCLTNSGNSKKHLHIINPQTGEYGKPTSILSVITDNASNGEVLSTSLCVCEPELKDIICVRLNGMVVQNEQ